MLRPPPPLQTLNKDTTSSVRVDPHRGVKRIADSPAVGENRRAHQEQPSSRPTLLATARDALRASTLSEPAARAGPAHTTVKPALATYLSLKAAYNLEAQESEDEDEVDADADAESTEREGTDGDRSLPCGSHTPRPSAISMSAIATSPIRTPLRDLVSPHQAPHRSPDVPYGAHRQTTHAHHRTLSQNTSSSALVASPASVHFIDRSATGSSLESVEWLSRRIEKELCHHLPAAASAILDALVAVEEGDDVPRILSSAIAAQLTLLTRQACTLAAREVTEMTAAAPTPAPHMTTSGIPQTSAGVNGDDVVRALREELRALRTALVESRQASTKVATRANGGPPDGTVPAARPRRPTREEMKTLSPVVQHARPTQQHPPHERQYNPVERPDPADIVGRHAGAPAVPRWVQSPNRRTREEEEMWRVAQRLIDESRAFDSAER